MKSIRTLLLVVVATVVSGTIAAADVERPAKSIPVPGSWIVELEAEPSLQFRGRDSMRLQGAGNAPAKGLAATAPEVTGARRFDTNASEVRTYAAWLDRQREAILDEARGYLGRPLEPSKVYRHVFNGFAAQMSHEEAAELAKVPGVRSVRQEMAHELQLDEGPSLIGASIVWSGMGENSTLGEGVVIGVIDSGINWDHRYFSDDPSDTGGHAFENPLGEQLGECSKASVPCNNKLIGVWDFTTEGTDGRDPDDNGHGTNVASIAAGNRWSFGLQDIDHQFNTSGVAPRANIVSYKVCYTEHPEDEELNGRCVGSAIAEALEQSVKDGVDVVNYSIGGTPDEPDPWQQAQAFLNVRNAGIVFVTSAGNDGPEPGTMSSPANAPWTFSIGSTSHRRRLGNSADVAGLTNLFAQQGSGPELANDITAPVIAADSVGDDLLGCEPFPTGAFDGAIAFMRRGDCLFEVKVNHAHDAGAVAVLIFNDVDNAFAIGMGGLEDTEIPSAMLDNQAGLEALDAIRSSSNPSATLFSSQQALLNSDWQDRMSDFSSRGPGPGAPGVMKPNVTAPGQDIIGGNVPDENSIGVFSGTSMASPHAAGAVALLKSAFSDWTPAMIQSALETTAQAGPVTDRGQPATMLDRGAGRLRVDRAARAGLFLPIEGSDFNDANPAFGGDPEALNLPGIHSVSCADLCTFTRTVRAINSGSWTVSTTGDALDISVTPESFSLDRGQEQELTIEVGAGQIDSGEFGDGAVVLSPSDSGMVTQRLPVGVLTVFAEVPEGFELVVQRNRGRSEVTLDTVGAMIEPAFRTSALVKPRRESFTLAQDPSPSDPYSGGAGRQTFLLDVPEETLMLFAETVASEAPDIDLFVGFDQNGDGIAQASEEVCRSTSPDELEQCIVKLPEPGQWWVLVQNWEASSETANDNVELDLAVLTHVDDPSLVVTGPGRHPGGALELPVSWDQPTMRRGERWLGALGLSNIPDELANVDVVPITFKRIFDQAVLPTALYAGEERSVVIAPQGEHDRLYFDVPPSASSVNVHVVGSAGVSAELRRMDFDEVVGHSPGTPPADGELMATGSGSSTGFEMTADAEVGRWYVVLDSIISSEALVDVSVEISESDPVRSQRGLWSPRDRLINQGIEWQRAGPGFMTWYSYDADGLPVFYQAAGEVDEDSSIWQAPLYRITNSTGQRQNADVVGEVSLTMLADNEMVFAWRLNGSHGSDIMAPDAAQTCPEVEGQEQSYSGHWFSPDDLVGGTTMIVTDSVQAHIRYYFDNFGIGRWLLASDPEEDPLNEVLELIDFRGFCPGCEQVEITTESVGVYTRVFESESAGAETVEFVSAEPLNHEISIDVPVVKLSEPLNCQ